MMNFILCLLWLVSMVLATDYECKRLGSIRQNCIDNPRVRITKATRNYRLALCTNNTCTSTVAWIKCKNVCPVCQSLLGQHECSDDDKEQCETELDEFLDNYCASAIYTSTATTTATTTYTTTGWRTATKWRTSPVTTTVLSTVTVTSASVSCSLSDVTINSMLPKYTPFVDEATALDSEHSSPFKGATITLGVFIGFLVLLLALFATGWILTYSKLKRNVPLEHDGTASTSTKEDERCFENPTYEETSTRLTLISGSVNNGASENVNSAITTYNTTHENGEDGPTYDVLSRAQATDHRQGRVVANLPGSEDYSRLGLYNSDLENNYQLLDEEELGSKVKN